MNNKQRILWITQTGMMIALLITSQAITAGLGNQFITGSIVNGILFVTTMMLGLYSGLTVAVLSNFFAFMLGIGPAMFPLVPFVAAGNATLVLVYWLIAGKRSHIVAFPIAGVIAGSVAKFAALYVGIVLIAAPHLLNLPPAAPVYFMFSWPQLVTALLGGSVALNLFPLLKRALKRGTS